MLARDSSSLENGRGGRGRYRRGGFRGNRVSQGVNFRGSDRGGTRGNFTRGGSRGRGRGGYRPRSVSETPPPPPLPRGPLIEKLRAAQLDDETVFYEDAATITNVKTVTSFNWMAGKSPTIMIPGLPPRWTPPIEPEKLPEDAGIYYRDLNAAHYPSHPIEPAVVAILDSDPALPRAIDVVACGSTLGNLYRFVHGVDKPFRMLAEMVHGTLFLVRRENAPDAQLEGVYGFGHTFVDTYTTWGPDMRGSKSHQRILQYTFGNLNLAVRFEVDGYLGKKDDDEKSEDKVDKKGKRPASLTIEDLTALLGNMPSDVSGNSDGDKASSASTGLTIRRGGHSVNRDSVFDIKTRSERKRDVEDTIGTEMPRLWVRQIDHLILGYHANGKFNDVQVLSMRDAVRDWEHNTENQLHLCRLAALLHRLITATRAAPGQRLEIILGDGRTTMPAGVVRGPVDQVSEVELMLELREQLPGVETALSPAVEEQWEKGLHLDLSDEEEETILTERHLADDDPPSSSEKSLQEKTDKKHDDVDISNLAVWDDGGEDYTACSAACGYCGECTY